MIPIVNRIRHVVFHPVWRLRTLEHNFLCSLLSFRSYHGEEDFPITLYEWQNRPITLPLKECTSTSFFSIVCIDSLLWHINSRDLSIFHIAGHSWIKLHCNIGINPKTHVWIVSQVELIWWCTLISRFIYRTHSFFRVMLLAKFQPYIFNQTFTERSKSE